MKAIAILFLILCASAQLCGLYQSECTESAKQQAVIYKYENKEFPHAADAKVVMYADETCGDSNAAVGVKFSVSLQDCKVNATDYTSCSTGKDVKGTFTMISNTAAASMSVSCEPPLADGESIDILTTTTQCMIAGMMDLIALLKEAGSEMIKGNIIDLKRVGDQLYMGDDLAFDLVDNTGCLAPTNDLLTLPANFNIGLVVIVAIVAIAAIASIAAIAVYKSSRNENDRTVEFDLV